MKNALRHSSLRLSRKTVTRKSGTNKQWGYPILYREKTRVHPGSAPSIRHWQCEYQVPGAGIGAASLRRRIEYAHQSPDRSKKHLPPVSLQIRRCPGPQAGTARRWPAVCSCGQPDPRVRTSQVQAGLCGRPIPRAHPARVTPPDNVRISAGEFARRRRAGPFSGMFAGLKFCPPLPLPLTRRG